MIEEKEKFYLIIGVLIIILVATLIFFSLKISKLEDSGDYNYCVEWLGFSDGILHRDNLIYTCYSLSTNTFFCWLS